MSTVVLALVCCLLVYPVASQPQGNGLRVPVQSSSSETCGNEELVSNIEEMVMSSFGSSQTGRSCGGPGWRQVAFINMTDPATNCPPGFVLTSNTGNLRVCGKASPYSRFTDVACQSTAFSTGGTPYTRVCGRIRSYLSGLAPVFQFSSAGIDGQYFHGISLTHGAFGSREHIWTFAAGYHSPVINDISTVQGACPCAPGAPDTPPSYVGNDYFCEGVIVQNGDSILIFPEDPLWDGQGCSADPDPLNTCECEFNNPPWFTKTLPSSTTDDIELRQCCSSGAREGGRTVICSTPFDLVELYIQ